MSNKSSEQILVNDASVRSTMFEAKYSNVVAEVENGQINYTELLKGSHEATVSKEKLEQEHTKVQGVVHHPTKKVSPNIPRIKGRSVVNSPPLIKTQDDIEHDMLLQTPLNDKLNLDSQANFVEIMEDGTLPLMEVQSSAINSSNDLVKQVYNPADVEIDVTQKPIEKYYKKIKKAAETQPESRTLKKYNQQNLELVYTERSLNPQIEQEIKEGFFEITKQFDEANEASQVETHLFNSSEGKDDSRQVYVSHLCLHNFHPVFCKMQLETVKLILSQSSIVYLNKKQILYSSNKNNSHFYIILFGKLRVIDNPSRQKLGRILNLGWTVGEENLFSGQKTDHDELCKSLTDSCLLALSKESL